MQTNDSDSNISINDLNNKEDNHKEKPDNNSNPFDFPVSVSDIPKIQEIIMDLSITADKLFDLEITGSLSVTLSPRLSRLT